MAFSPTVKVVAEKSLNVNKTAIKICQNKRPVSNILSLYGQKILCLNTVLDLEARLRIILLLVHNIRSTVSGVLMFF